MEIVAPSIELFIDKPAEEVYKSIERAGRVCYKSEDRATEESYTQFIRSLIKRGHLAVIEHEKVTIKIICDRGVTHELVRHRIGSYCQESTRYVNYKEGIRVIQPSLDTNTLEIWKESMLAAEKAYRDLITLGVKPQIARGVLPNSLKTEIMVTFNLREWRHFLEMRTSKAAHPQMREIAIMIYRALMDYVPLFFEDIKIEP